MYKQPVLNILKDIFRAYGYEVDSSYISDMVANKGTTDRIYVKLDMDVDYNSMQKFADSIRQTHGAGLYILNNTGPGELLDFAHQHDLVFWDRRELENQIGKAILANAEGIPMELKLQRPEKQSITPFQSSSTETSSGIFGGLFSEPAPSKPEPRFKWPEFDRPSGTQLPPANQEERIIRIPLPSMPINMAKTSALKISRSKIGDIQDCIMKFIPFYSYRYDFEIQSRFRSKIIDLNGQGEGMINAINGENKFSRVPQPMEYIDIPTENYQIKEPQITDIDARTQAIGAIIQKHSKNMKMDEVKGDAIVYESRTLSPAEQDINLSIHLIYIPIWEVQGRQHSIEINAYDGHIMEEPVDDDAEFV